MGTCADRSPVRMGTGGKALRCVGSWVFAPCVENGPIWGAVQGVSVGIDRRKKARTAAGKD